MCSFFTRSRAKFIAVTVGDIDVQIRTTNSSDSLAPHKMISVILVHLLISIGILLDLRGLYISPSEVVDSAPLLFCRVALFSIEAKLIVFSWLVLSNLLRMVEISAYFESEMSREI